MNTIKGLFVAGILAAAMAGPVRAGGPPQTSPASPALSVTYYFLPG